MESRRPADHHAGQLWYVSAQGHARRLPAASQGCRARTARRRRAAGRPLAAAGGERDHGTDGNRAQRRAKRPYPSHHHPHPRAWRNARGHPAEGSAAPPGPTWQPRLDSSAWQVHGPGPLVIGRASRPTGSLRAPFKVIQPEPATRSRTHQALSRPAHGWPAAQRPWAFPPARRRPYSATPGPARRWRSTPTPTSKPAAMR
jgi:hypothetical protein